MSTLLTHKDTAALIEMFIRAAGKEISYVLHQESNKQSWLYKTAVVVKLHHPPSTKKVIT